MTLSPSDLLDLVIGKAKGLRKAGVLELVFDGVTLKLAPHEEQDDPVALTPEAGDEIDPMNDPRTYGLRGRLPGFDRLHDGDDAS